MIGLICKVFFLAASLGVSSQTLWAQERENLNQAKNTFNPSSSAQLTHLLQQAEQFSSGLKADAYQKQANEYRAIQSLSGLLPSVQAYGNVQFLHSKPSQGNSFNGSSYGVGINAQQPIYRVDKILNIEQAGISEQIAHHQYQTKVQELYQQVINAYIQLLQQQTQLQTLEKKIASTQVQVEQAQKQFDVGVITITDVYEARARLDQLLAQKALLQTQMRVQQTQLRTLTGVSIEFLNDIDDNIDLNKIEALTEEKIEQPAQHPTVKLAATQVLYQQKEYEKTKKLSYPTVDLVANVQKNKTAQGFSSGHNASVGLQVSVPLFTGFGQGYKEKESAALYAKAQQDLVRASQQWQFKVESAQAQLRGLLAQHKALLSTKASAEKSRQATKTAFEVGIRIGLDVLNAQDAVLDAEKNLKTTRYALLEQALQLKMLQGSFDHQTWQSFLKS